jgi:uncharacterized membrane protein
VRDGFLFASAFIASAVEMVEALTIVLASGLTRGWRSSLAGLGAATVVLAVIVAALGPALTLVPLSALRLLVGGLPHRTGRRPSRSARQPRQPGH